MPIRAGDPPDGAQLWIDRVIAGTHTIGVARAAFSAKAAYRSTAAFQVCFVGDKDSHGGLDDLPALAGTDLFGPALLQNCSDEVAAPCITGRGNVGDDSVIEFTIPAEDPWMR